jgi:hypothetical protein
MPSREAIEQYHRDGSSLPIDVAAGRLSNARLELEQLPGTGTTTMGITMQTALLFNQGVFR